MGNQKVVRYEALRASILPGHGFGHYFLDLLDKEQISIKKFCRQASAPPHIYVNENALRRWIRGQDRTMTTLDLIRFAVLLHSSPVEMLVVYMEDKPRYADLSEQGKHQVALYTTFLTILTKLPETEQEEWVAIARTRAERLHLEIDQERGRLHKAHAGGFASSGKGKR